LIAQGLLIAFAVCTVLLIAVHMLAVMISTCILPHVEAVSNLHLQTSNTVFESPHRKMSKIIELAWAFSTVLGILLFLGKALSTHYSVLGVRIIRMFLGLQDPDPFVRGTDPDPTRF
jgi:hypothetical protein